MVELFAAGNKRQLKYFSNGGMQKKPTESHQIINNSIMPSNLGQKLAKLVRKFRCVLRGWGTVQPCPGMGEHEVMQKHKEWLRR